MKSKMKLISFLVLLMMVIGCQNPFGPDLAKNQDGVRFSASTLSRGAVTGKPVGWGKDVTGGGSGRSVTVSSFNDLKNAINDSSVKVIKVKGTINISSRLELKELKDKSIIGLSGAKLKSTNQTKNGSGIFYAKRCTNLIIQNLVFEGPGAYDTDGWDNLALDDCQKIWVDHCDFQDGVDGNFDIKNKSDNISVTWCVFQYKKPPKAGGSGGSPDHRYSNLIGSSDSATADEGKLKVTFYYSRWGQGCRERMPRVRYGQVHILNCLYDSSVSNHCIRAGKKANILVEGSYFDNQKLPIDLFKGDYSAVKASKNSGCSDISKGSIFKPGYSYSVDSASSISSPIKKYAGATLGNGSNPPSPTNPPSGDGSCSLSGSASGTSAKLKWSYKNVNVKSQDVYRDTDSDPSGRVRIAGGVSGTSYTDKNLSNGTYYYWIKTRDTNGTTINSNALKIVISGSSSSEGSCSLSVSASGSSAKLKWSYKNVDVKSQEVYRDTDSNPSGRVRIAKGVSGTSYTDKGLSTGTYYYWIKTLDKNGKTINSNAGKVTIK